MKLRLLIVVVCLAGVGGIAWRMSRSGPVEMAEIRRSSAPSAPVREELKAVIEPVHVRSPAVSVGKSILNSPQWRQRVEVVPGKRRVTVCNRELDPVTNVWHHSELPISWPFAVVNVASSRANRLFVLGEARDGVFVVERVELDVSDGAYDSARAPGGPTSIALVGGAFVEPAMRAPVVANREELFRSKVFGALVQITVDPDERFVLALAHNNGGADALRIDVATGDVTVIASSSALPGLPFARTLMSASHAAHGLVYVAVLDGSPSFISDYVVFVDSNRDGNIDLSVQLTEQDFLLGGYLAVDQFDGLR